MHALQFDQRVFLSRMAIFIYLATYFVLEFSKSTLCYTYGAALATLLLPTRFLKWSLLAVAAHLAIQRQFSQFILSPEEPLVAVLLISFSLRLFDQKKNSKKIAPAMDLWIFVWLSLLSVHFLSGLSKLFYGDRHWIEGTALEQIILTSPFVRPWASVLVPEFSWGLKLFSWGSLVIELLAFPCLFHPVARRTIWWLLVFMHLGILLIHSFAQVSLGILLYLFFIKLFFDPLLMRKVAVNR